MITMSAFLEESSSGSTSSDKTSVVATLTETQTRILFVDDDPQISSFSKLVLARAGYAVDTAGDGVEAWAALQKQSYDLLMTDYQMPRIDGLELIRKVRMANMRVPIILVSSLVGSSSIEGFPGDECCAALGKPFTASDLTSVVREALKAPSNSLPECVVAAA